jgi:ABC-type antimicrobial peptide transport system permease subunit
MSLVKRTFRTPAVAVSVAGTFAGVIALVTAIFAVINAVWLNALPFAEPRNVVVIGRTSVTAPSPEMLRAVVAAVEPSLPVMATERMIDRVSQHTARTRFLTTVIGGIATVALLIAAGGIFGLTSYSVRRRRQEFGLRMALGADHRAIAGQVLRGLVAPATVGIAAGLGLSWMVNRSIRTFMFGLGPNDPVVALTAVALLALVLVLSCLVPLRRALAIEPAEALRRE